jgi:carnitine O-acetyltransferase
MMGEHSPCDALIPSILGDYCVEAPMNMDDFGPASTEKDLSADRASGWRRIDWATDGYLQSECQRVAEQAQTLIEDSDDSQLWFEDYGVDWIRGIGQFLTPYKGDYIQTETLFFQPNYLPMLISKWHSN